MMNKASRLEFDNRSCELNTEGMVLIPAGSFSMGSEDGGDFERPVHEVFLDAYWMDATPVTNGAFARFAADTQYETDAERAGAAWGYDGVHFRRIAGLSWRIFADRRETHPVVLVSWNDASAYATWRGKRLPTEAEWERAARGGVTGKLYPWGDDCPDGTQSTFSVAPSPIPPTSPVDRFPPNAFGLYDMVGNVWQWCSDIYDDTYYAHSPLTNPLGPSAGNLRVRRGGSWNVIQPFRLRCANRGAFEQALSAPNLGFRCAAAVTHACSP
jgi:formylglycine-generating enzyme